MMTNYRGANQHNLLWVAIVLSGVPLTLVLFYFLDKYGLKDRLGIFILIPAAIPLVFVIGFAVCLLKKFNRERVSKIRTVLELRGFLFTTDPKPEVKATFYPSLAGVFASWGADRGPESLQWIALSEQSQNRRAIVEYIYFTGSGKSTQEHQFTVLAWPSSHSNFPEALINVPSVSLWRVPWWARGIRRKNDVIPIPGLEIFQKKWWVTGNLSTAQLIITPLFISTIERSPRNEMWYFGQGWICACSRSTLDAKNLSLFIDHAEHVLRSSRIIRD